MGATTSAAAMLVLCSQTTPSVPLENGLVDLGYVYTKTFLDKTERKLLIFVPFTLVRILRL